MTVQHEELLARYFEHRMSAAEEQDFLIQLAASDTMRVAFRSHLELERAIHDDKDELRSLSAIRQRTLAAVGMSAVAVTPFLEQSRTIPQHVEAATVEPSTMVASARTTSLFGRILRLRSVLVGGGLLVGFLAGGYLYAPTTLVATSNQSAPARTVSVSPSTTSLPASSTDVSGNSVNSQERAALRETIPSSKGLIRTVGVHSAPATSVRHRDAVVTPSSNANQAASTVVAPSMSHSALHPVVTVSKPGRLHVQPAAVSNVADSTTTP